MNARENAFQSPVSAVQRLSLSSCVVGKRGYFAQVIDEVNLVARQLRGLDDSKLREQTSLLRDQFGSTTHRETGLQGPGTSRMSDRRKSMALATAAAVEALRRSKGITLYPTQILAGLAMCHGKVAEMQTGEGKTFAGFIPAYVFAVVGRGVHVCMPNAYLASRDESLLRPAFSLLGVTTAVRVENDSFQVARRAYDAEVTYGAGQLFGFDYLRDQWTKRNAMHAPLGTTTVRRLLGQGVETQMRMRGLFAAVVDEADQVLVDDATSPLLITTAEEQIAADASLHHAARNVAFTLQAESEFRIDKLSNGIELTDRGFGQVYEDESLATHSLLARPWHAYVVSALKAEYLFRRDRHYVVVDGCIRLVEQSTGRIFGDRSWSDGLHQAVQAKEGLPITAETPSQGRIARQSFFRLYKNLCGMTGTARSCRKELRSIYGLDVIAIPTNRPSQRRLLETRVYSSEADKLQGVIRETLGVIGQGRSVLIGTNHIDQTNRIAQGLRDAGIHPFVLNGIQSEQEANIIAGAGRSQVVTVATHLAGRGTDIRLAPSVNRAGGLHVIAWEHHRLSRVDRQLIGRGARQGDPGTARFCVSPDDQFISRHAPYLAPAVAQCAVSPDMIDGLGRAILAAQRRAESHDRRLRFRLMRQNEHSRTVMSGGQERSRPKRTASTLFGVIQ